MMLRIAVYALIAMGLGGFGTIAWVVLNPPAPPPVQMAAQVTPLPPAPDVAPKILVAARALRAGTLLKPDDIEAVDAPAAPVGEMPAAPVAAGAPIAPLSSSQVTMLDTPQMRAGLKGAMVRHSMAEHAVLQPADVVRPGDFGFLAAVLAPGMRGVTIGVDAVSGSAGLIWPGDRVDVILTQDLEDKALSPGRRVVGETILTDLRVIAIDQQLAQGVNPQGAENALARTATLEVTPKQVETVTVASRLGRLSIVVRAAETTPLDGTAPMAVAVVGPASPAPAPPAAATTLKVGTRDTTWGSDVSPALAAPAPSGTTLRVFTGSADGKEFKF